MNKQPNYPFGIYRGWHESCGATLRCFNIRFVHMKWCFPVVSPKCNIGCFVLNRIYSVPRISSSQNVVLRNNIDKNYNDASNRFPIRITAYRCSPKMDSVNFFFYLFLDSCHHFSKLLQFIHFSFTSSSTIRSFHAFLILFAPNLIIPNKHSPYGTIYVHKYIYLISRKIK